MPPTAQRLREPAAFVLLGYGVISTLFNSITFLFGPGNSGSTFSQRAIGTVHTLDNVVLTAALVGAVMLAHVGTQLKLAKLISLVALVTIGVAALFGVVALFSTFGADSMMISGWGKTTTFFVGLSELAVAGVGGWLILGYFQQHGPVRPVQPYGQPPAGQWQQPQQQWQPPQAGAPAPQPWGPPQGGPQQQVPPQQQPWGAPPPAGPQGGAPQGAFNPSDSMATQAIPAIPQPQQPAPQPAPETQQFPPVGNWTSEG